jgi:hypothetical protein
MSPCFTLSLMLSTTGSDDLITRIVPAILAFGAGYAVSWLPSCHAHRAGWLEGCRAARDSAARTVVEQSYISREPGSWNGANAAQALPSTRRPGAPAAVTLPARRN